MARLFFGAALGTTKCPFASGFFEGAVAVVFLGAEGFFKCSAEVAEGFSLISAGVVAATDGLSSCVLPTTPHFDDGAPEEVVPPETF